MTIEEIRNNPLFDIAKLVSAEQRKFTLTPPPVAERVANVANAQGLLDSALLQG